MKGLQAGAFGQAVLPCLANNEVLSIEVVGYGLGLDQDTVILVHF